MAVACPLVTECLRNAGEPESVTLDAAGQRSCNHALVRLTGRKIPFDRDFIKNAEKHVAEWKAWWKEEGEKRYGEPKDK